MNVKTISLAEENEQLSERAKFSETEWNKKTCPFVLSPQKNHTVTSQGP